MTESTRKLADIEVIGGHPAVDFVNTLTAWDAGSPEDYLHSYDDLLEWSVMADLIGPLSVKRLSANPEADKLAALEAARALRASMYAIFSARAAGKVLPRKALDHLNDVIRETIRWRRLGGDSETGFTEICCMWNFSGAPASAVLGPVAWKAAELLELGDLSRLKGCLGEHCGWLFLDTSKNRSRQWCSMKTCGNVAKVKRFREKASG